MSIKDNAGLVKLLKPGEDLQDFLALPDDAKLLRWVNYHLKNAGSKPIRNIESALADGKVYTILLN